MKQLVWILCSLCLLALYQCTTSKPAGTSFPEKQEITNNQSNQSLADALRKNTSLQVTGSGDNVKILIRGAGTIQLNTQPLFVVNGVRMGNSYASANSAVNPNEIVSIRVLKSLSDTAIYGEEGNHGVIVIKTKGN